MISKVSTKVLGIARSGEPFLPWITALCQDLSSPKLPHCAHFCARRFQDQAQESCATRCDGRLLLDQIVKMDLEGIVCKRKDSPYKVTDKPSRYWIKVKNSRYSQLEGREELFERL